MVDRATNAFTTQIARMAIDVFQYCLSQKQTIETGLGGSEGDRIGLASEGADWPRLDSSEIGLDWLRFIGLMGFDMIELDRIVLYGVLN